MIEKNRKTGKKMSNVANISQNWLEFLIPYTDDYAKKFSGSELARALKKPQRSVSRYLSLLVKNNLLRCEMVGRNKMYYMDLLNNKSKLLINVIESYKAFLFSMNADLWLVVSEFMNFGDVVLFGSYAKSYATKFSDIDLILIGKKSKEIMDIARKFGRVNLHFVSLKEYERLLMKKKTLAVEIAKGHVVFGGLNIVDVFWRFFRNG